MSTVFDNSAVSRPWGVCRNTSSTYAVLYSRTDTDYLYAKVYDSNGILAVDTITVYASSIEGDGRAVLLPISANGFVVVMHDALADKGYLKYYDSTGALVGAATEWHSGQIGTGTGGSTSLAACKLNNNNIAIVYVDRDDSYKGKFVVYNESGTSIVAATTFHNAATTSVSCSVLSNNNFVITYVDAADSNKGKFVVFTAAGAAVVTETEFATGLHHFSYNWQVVRGLDNGNFVVAYHPASTTNGYFKVVTNAGAAGSATQFSSAVGNAYLSVSATGYSQFTIGYSISTSPYDLKSVVYNTALSLVVTAETIATSSLNYQFAAVTTSPNLLFTWHDFVAGTSKFSFEFIIYPPVDRIIYKRLVAAANNKIYYEDLSTPGTLVELTAAANDIDTTDQLTMFEGFQSVFIINGTNLKVADFINTKLTHTALTTAHAKGDILTQATSTAQMIVDFTDSTKTHTYGFVTSGTFDATNLVSGTGSGTAFTPSAVTTDPHWHDLTVYPGGVSGSLPAKAYLGCLYRGRCVLSGNTNYPFQWYMSRTADPWDWLYAANDAQSPVAGGNSDAGELGDVVRALIPYKDEYLLFGCANSLWVLRGDPAYGGSLDEVDLTVGMFGANSWCFDGQGNMYFFSSSGLYKMLSNLGGVIPVSEPLLPGLGQTEALDPSTHRISMVYDPDRYGIGVFITTLATGANSNYFYDLRTEGIYPETYPSSCGVYSAMYYAANDPDYRGVVLGSTDGYIRTFDDSEKNDVGTSTDSTITSSVVLPVLQNDDDDREIRINSLTITAAGGDSGGAYAGTDAVTVNIYTGDSAEEVLEAIEDGDTPHTTVEITGSGRQNRIRNRVRGHSVAVELKNNTSDSTWSVERVSADAESVGKVR